MTTGERIKDLRIKRHMTADQLAELVGVNRATIYRYESGDIENMSVDVLKPLAAALHTTPAALMGWDDTSAPEVKDLTSDEIALLSDFRQLSEDGQGKLLDYASDLVASGRYKKATRSDFPGSMAKEA